MTVIDMTRRLPLPIEQISTGMKVSVSLCGGPRIPATVKRALRAGVLIEEGDSGQTLVPAEDVEDGTSALWRAA